MLFPTPDLSSHRPAQRTRGALAAALLLCVLGAGCAASAALRNGRDAELRQNYDLAVVEFTKALRLKPDSSEARAGLERAKLRASQEHFSRARRLAATGKLEEALAEYEIARELNPTSADIDDELRSARSRVRTQISLPEGGKTQLQTLIERSRDFAPDGLDLPADVKMPESLTFRDAGSRDVFTTIARMANLSLVFDPTFRDAPVTVDLRNASLQDALHTVAGATRTFYQVTAPRTIIVVPDTPAKRREYEEEVVRTFYLSNADLKETMDMLRMVLDARRLSPVTATNAITIKDTPEHVAAAARVIAAIDKARPEVLINVELLEVDRQRLLEYGLQIASPGSPGLDGSVSIATDPNGTIGLDALRNLSESDVIFANFPSLFYRLLKTDTNTRVLANPSLRTSEGMPAQARFGERVPVPQTTFAPIATGGAPQQPITSFAYENIGVNLDITPRTHHDDDITLTLNVAVTSISGEGFGGLPTFGNREVKNVIRLRDGETNMLAGLIRDNERNSLNGIPGLSDLPVIGRLFGHTQKESQQTDIILTLTPHIIRVLELSEADLRPFRVGTDSAAPLSEIPVILAPPAPEVQPPAQEPPPPQAPIFPPVMPPQTPIKP
jgi:general secretion pathway protein D